ncbi:MAG: CDP-diacylglycerol--glycerol-3-phosphate 3-phosphatidyltransferase [Pseudomonadota bacterium]
MWTLPNILTASRILAAPIIALAAMAPAGSAWTVFAFALFVVAALTDFFDGWIARRFDMRSGFGAMLDPIADKVMAIVIFAVLIGMSASYHGAGTGALSEVPAILVAGPCLVMIVRELMVAGLREFIGGIRLAVTPLARWKTTVQLTAAGVLLFVHALPAIDMMTAPGTGGIPAHLALMPEPAYETELLMTALVLLWLAMILTVWTAFDYFKKGWPHVAARKDA